MASRPVLRTVEAMDTAIAPAAAARHERKVERRFDRLPASYLVHRDVVVPGRAALIDHVVIGATGAFAVRSMGFSREVTVRGPDAQCDGRSLQPVVDDLRTDAHALSKLLDVEVRSVMVVHGARLRVVGHFSTSMVQGVRFCEPNKLPGILTTPPCTLSAELVGALSARLS